MEVCKNDENQRKQAGQEPVQPGTDGTENVADIQLGNGQQIERSCKQPDPCGAANGMKQQSARGNAGVRQICEKAKQQRRAEDDFRVARVEKPGNDLGVENAVDQRGNRENKAHKRAGRAHVEESPAGSNRRANQNEGPKGTDERGERNEVWVTGADVMMAPGEEMAELVGQQDGEQGEGEAESCTKGGGVLVEQGPHAYKFHASD